MPAPAALAVEAFFAAHEVEMVAAVVARPAVFAVAEVVGAALCENTFARFEFGGGAVFTAHVGVVDLQLGATVAVVRPEFVIAVIEGGDAA